MVEMTFKRNKDGSISLVPCGETAKILAPVMPGGHLREQLFLDPQVRVKAAKSNWRLIKKRDLPTKS